MSNECAKKLPLGGFTYSWEEYSKAWNELGKKAELFFPGYEFCAYDPHIYLERREITERDTYRTLDRITLTPHSVTVLGTK